MPNLFYFNMPKKSDLMSKQYINIDGIIKPQENFVLTSSNRAFKYGDALFETMFSASNKIPFYNQHIDRLIFSMKILKMEIPSKFVYNKEGFFYEITRLLNKNKLHKGARVRITVYRHPGGLYTPISNKVSYLIETLPIQYISYELNKKGIEVDIFKDFYKTQNILSNIKSTNSLIYILAGIYMQENQLTDILLINQNNNIIESLSSNIFVIKNNKIYTPALIDGCINGVMRNYIIELAKQNNIPIELSSILINDLLEVDEIFLTNSISGIRWVGAYKRKRYYNKFTISLFKLFHQSLSKLLF